MSLMEKIRRLLGRNIVRNNTPDIDSDIAINVEHLTMEFKVSNDKIDTLKEYFIRTIKRDKGESKKVKVLDDISFTVKRGEKLGILGFNGAGKSTLLRIIAGIYEPSDGQITINGKIAPLLELSAGFDKNYSGKDNIYLNGALLSMSKEFLDEKYDEIVEYSELGDYINYPVKNYSKGMKAKLGFSIATLIDPDILIIDEILSVGDIKFRKKSGEKLNEMMADGVTVLLVSHSINQVRRICDRCIWIDSGELIMEGEVNEVCDAYVEDANYAKIKKERKMKRKLRKKYG
ncbi:MAG: ABC transporter ATP-binding protein [Methanobrevibacter sp.]|uniref:ABC transporter ATP-binding protein n=1 Tax=Methanobrevibacter sp. TaxID=66852 RepID=UPI001B64B065|nr:ABC transporter ATP-binding protein [Methanobrevibacter sp.]MBP3790458.1 ABC transporter ATP-binding protein [Methanobrevibacter sp.]